MTRILCQSRRIALTRMTEPAPAPARLPSRRLWASPRLIRNLLPPVVKALANIRPFGNRQRRLIQPIRRFTLVQHPLGALILRHRQLRTMTTPTTISHRILPTRPIVIHRHLHRVSLREVLRLLHHMVAFITRNRFRHLHHTDRLCLIHTRILTTRTTLLTHLPMVVGAIRIIINLHTAPEASTRIQLILLLPSVRVITMGHRIIRTSTARIMIKSPK
jgi:hypothetical protein